MLKRGICFFLGLLFFLPPSLARGAEARIFTLWPLLDYRHSAAGDFTSVHLLGPLIKYEKRGKERQFALRPLYFHAWAPERKRSRSEYLYPVASKESEPGLRSFQGLHLLTYDFGDRETGSRNKFMLFPFLFYGKTEHRGSYFAFFPLGGKVYHLLSLDEIRFVLFPLYGQVRKKGTTVTYWLWPIFSTTHGKGETGWKVWPFYGQSQKKGVYRKRFYLWPFGYVEDLRLNTNDQERVRAVFPFYVAQESPQRESHTYLWPLFSHVVDRRKGYEEWDFPWPFLRKVRGAHRQVRSYLPFYEDARGKETRKRWFLWPLYKIDEIHTADYDRRRDRVLFFLYSDLKETVRDGGIYSKRRISFWPLFTYKRKEGVSRLSILSLLEPFFPENQAIQRNWSPLWHLYQSKWDRRGDEATSFLWNLYWKERRGRNLAMEVFPLFFYRREKGQGTDFTLLKGLFRYHVGKNGTELRLFYLPWGFHWGQPVAASRG